MEYKEAMAMFAPCNLCPRGCGTDRLSGKAGACRVGAKLLLARAALHFWEEPCISGTKGSGAVFFSGCSLGCVFCQNQEISRGQAGKEVSPERLSEIFLELEAKGAANLNLVTATHYVPWVIYALDQARIKGFSLPVVYNSSGYESLETLRRLKGYVDIYLPDMKYADKALAKALSGAEDYPETALAAIAEMRFQTGACAYDGEGYLKKGTLIRHLILPGATRNSIRVLELLRDAFGTEVEVSLMNQYTPVSEKAAALWGELGRKVTAREYDKVLKAAFELGLENGYAQEGETAKESFIPAFDAEGV